ncbi:Formate nitrite transporter [Hondaea fermentalgiana]|uniref:Formate nitrite transporter n=1 Tax=Hondaea fermentalgiana TaxID=2315210 RepID=A0A2R5GVK4_9STRA|nr:Formate nitrite transporter [Hondaea fermentalgiana]|eukprot:GBG34876.1 Formate nitrite transporter [Hondaea fermentalgiana]
MLQTSFNTMTSANESSNVENGHGHGVAPQQDSPSARSDVQNMLASLGVKEPRDITLLSEDDLRGAGMNLVDARRVLKEARENVDMESQRSAEPPTQLKLSAGQQAMVDLNNTALIRADRNPVQMMLSAILAGIMLSWGGALYVVLAAGTKAFWAEAPGLHSLISAAVFPMGLTGILLTGSDLLTSNMMYGTMPFATMDPRRENMRKFLSSCKLLSISFVGNFLSCALMAAYISPMVVTSEAATNFVVAVAEKKVAGGLGIRFARAIAANWLVNIAVFQAACVKSAHGKMIVLWLPITAFVACGFEHSVANMFLVPLGMYNGADVSVGDFLGKNLFLVIFGNAIGAGIGVGWLHWYAMVPTNYWVLTGHKRNN